MNGGGGEHWWEREHNGGWAGHTALCEQIYMSN